MESPAAVAAVQPLVHGAAYLPREQGTPQPDEQPTAFIAILQDDRLPGANDVDSGLALGSLTAAAWAHGVDVYKRQAYRSLPRLSSAPSAKAFSLRPL